jgi:hypothetical protein
MRLPSILVLVAACGTSGPPTGAASISNSAPVVMSADSVPFTGADGSGKMVLGWKIELIQQGPGTDCKADTVNVLGNIGVFSNQIPDAQHKVATLTNGDIVIVRDSPPTVQGTFAATMGLSGVTAISGTVSLDNVGMTLDGKINKISGTVNAGGKDINGNNVMVTGTFVAPICE